MYGVVRFLDTEILPASAPEGFPKIIKSGIDEEGQHPKSPAITGPDGIATLLYHIGYPEALKRLLDTQGTEEFNLRVYCRSRVFQDVYIGFVCTVTGRLADHGVRYIIQRDPEQRVGKWVPLSTSDLGSSWDGPEDWIRAQGAAVTKGIWFNQHWDRENIDISWSGMSTSDKESLAAFMQERHVKLAQKRAQREAEEREEMNLIGNSHPNIDTELSELRYRKRQMECRAKCGEKNPGLQCSKCKFARYCSSACQAEDWKYHKTYCGAVHQRFW
ncbi:mynd domain [Moniliophthora roreri MCA 2997]|uniref:Mynd domain n=1 Tax=Moniliophthora roreri (strain MCA 2997) TaxID=1381753 RepID=V2X4R3_MONRO|nr:mynd domain [Moniliophthora roreri MCA 2997]